MTVNELIEKLKTMPPDMQVVVVPDGDEEDHKEICKISRGTCGLQFNLQRRAELMEEDEDLDEDDIEDEYDDEEFVEDEENGAIAVLVLW
jgi:hypothetical protein